MSGFPGGAEGPQTLADAIGKYGAMVRSRGVRKGRVHTVACGCWGLADLQGFPDGRRLPEVGRAALICRLFAEEAAGSDVAETYARFVRHLDDDSACFVQGAP